MGVTVEVLDVEAGVGGDGVGGDGVGGGSVGESSVGEGSVDEGSVGITVGTAVFAGDNCLASGALVGTVVSVGGCELTGVRAAKEAIEVVVVLSCGGAAVRPGDDEIVSSELQAAMDRTSQSKRNPTAMRPVWIRQKHLL